VRGHMYDALTVPGTGLAQVTAIVLTFAMGRPDELFAISWVSSATVAAHLSPVILLWCRSPVLALRDVGQRMSALQYF
jgi:hypothetical protein